MFDAIINFMYELDLIARLPKKILVRLDPRVEQRGGKSGFTTRKSAS